MAFDAACDRYLAQRKVDMEHPEHERYMARSLRPFFHQKRLNQITPDDIREYQTYRLAQGRHPNTVNHEVKMLFRLLKRAKLLSRVRDDVKLLPVKREPRRMLSEDEKHTLLSVAASKPEWQLAYCAALLTANTTMRPAELKRLLWRDIDSTESAVIVRRSKTDAGTRVIPLNADSLAALSALEQRARALETYGAERYVFPRLWPQIDGTRPMGRNGWRSAWRSLRKAAGFPRLRFYDLRHQCITELAEGGVPAEVIREVAGHVDPAMMRWYSHPRLEARRRAVAILGLTKGPAQEGGHVTIHVTKRASSETKLM